MASARMRHEWNQTADFMALFANANKAKGVPDFTRSNFHPMMPAVRNKGARLTGELIRSRRAMFTK